MIKVSEKTQDSLAELWYNKDFQVLVKLLQNRLDLLGKGVLTIRDSEIIKEDQMEAQVIVKFIKNIKDAALKVEKRQKKGK